MGREQRWAYLIWIPQASRGNADALPPCLGDVDLYDDLVAFVAHLLDGGLYFSAKVLRELVLLSWFVCSMLCGVQSVVCKASKAN